MLLPRLRLTLFGPFEAYFDEQSLSGFTVEKTYALLAYMAIESGKPHRRESLAGLLWPDYPNEIALRNLRQSLYRLRQILQGINPTLPDEIFTQTRQTITLHTQAITVDAIQFTDLYLRVKTAPDPLPILTQISSIYQGELLTGLSIPDAYAFDEWLNIQREVFHQQAVESLTHLTALYESFNRPDDALTSATRLLAIEPWHEESHRQIMKAHLRNGNRSLAIAQYNELKTILARELGVEPAPATLSLFNQIQTATVQDEDLPSTLPEPRLPLPTQPLNLPTPPTPLIGRLSELEKLSNVLHDPNCRLLTLTGPGGMGKTRLGVEIARRISTQPNRFSDGIVFVPLAQIEHGGLLIATIAQHLGLHFQQRTDLQEELLTYLKNKHLLLFLDNFEHLLGSAEAESIPVAVSFLTQVITSAPEVTLLVTSRETLTLQGEWVFPVDALEYAPFEEPNPDNINASAPQLFIHTARRHRSTFDPTTQTDAILEICRLTSGLPLALEMAAAWMRVYDCQEIVQLLTQSLDFLTNPYRDAPARQRNMRAVFDSSWNQLAVQQQNTLASLSVFRGGFTVQAALAVGQATVLDLAALVEKSFIHRTGEGRYEIHELLRQFAAEKLSILQKNGYAHDRHSEFYLSYLAEQTPGINGTTPQDSLTNIRRDLDNIRLAWNWAVSHARIDLLEKSMEGLTQFMILTGINLDGEKAIKEAIAAIQSSPEEHKITLSLFETHLAWLRIGLGKNQEASKNIQTALALSEASQDPFSKAHALSLYGWLLQTQGDFDEAETSLREAYNLFETLGNPMQLSLTMIRLGSLFWRQNDIEKAQTYYLQSLQIEQKAGNKRGINRALGGIGLAYLNLEKYDQAIDYLEKALQLDREMGNRPGIPRHLGHLGNIYLHKGKYKQAVASYQEALEIDQKIGNKNTTTIWLGNLGRVFARMNQFHDALEYFEQAILIAREIENRYHLCEVLLGKAEILITLNKAQEAQEYLEEALSLSREFKRLDTLTQGQILSSRLLTQTGDPTAARALLESMLNDLAPDNKEDETRARLYYELWKTDLRENDARKALTYYEACIARTEYSEYTERIAEIQRYLIP